MSGEVILFSVGPFTLTAYGLCMALAALAGLLATQLMEGKSLGRDNVSRLWCWVTLGAVIGGHLVWCLSMFNAVRYDYNAGLSLLWKGWLGGVTLYGGLLGGMAGAWIGGMQLRQPFRRLMDAALPGACVALLIGRLAEIFSEQGLGAWVEEESLHWFPLAICTYSDGDFSEWHIPVFLYEAFAALALLLIVLSVRRTQRRDGERTGIFLTLLGCTQIFFEQLRQDDYPRFGFVRFTQLAAIAVITVILLLRMRRDFLARVTRISRFCLLLAAVMVVIFVEFTLEKPQMLIWLRLSILLTAGCLVWAQLRVGKPRGDTARFLIFSLEVAVALALVLLLHLDLPWENALIYLVMALAVSLIGWTTLITGDAKV